MQSFTHRILTWFDRNSRDISYADESFVVTQIVQNVMKWTQI